MILMFNKSNGELIGNLPEGTKVKGLNGKEVMTKVVEYDPDTHFYNGTFHDGKVEPMADYVAEVPVIEEDVLDRNVAGNIEGEYPIYKQLNIIIEMLNQSSVPNTAEFTAMYNYIKDERERNSARKEVYKDPSSPYIYVSKEDLLLTKNKKLGKA